MIDTPSTQTQTEVVDATLDGVHSIELTKREFILIVNTLVKQQYSLGDANLIIPIVDKLFPIASGKEDTPVLVPSKE